MAADRFPIRNISAQPGLDALRAMLMHANHYGLKWVIVHDPYYDPLLTFAGWRQVDSIEDKTVTIWSKDGVPPATPLNAPQMPPALAGTDVGHLSLRKQPSGDSGLADSGKETPGSGAANMPSIEDLVHGRMAS